MKTKAFKQIETFLLLSNQYFSYSGEGCRKMFLGNFSCAIAQIQQTFWKQGHAGLLNYFAK